MPIRWIFAIGLLAYSFANAQSVGRITVAPGCEDFAFDSAALRPRLIVSCDDRRKNPSRGGLFALDLASHAVTALKVVGISLPSFHPHGIDLIRVNGESLLYVISHQYKNQSGAGKNFTDVLVFRLRGNRLEFRANLGGAGVAEFKMPNDLAALPSGEVFLSNPTSLSQSVLYYSPTDKKWRVAAKGFYYPNGIFFASGQLFVNDSVRGRQVVYRHSGGGQLRDRRVWANGLGAADNITANASGERVFAGARSFWTFAYYFLKPDYLTPSQVLRSHGNQVEQLRKPSLDYLIKAPSVAFEYENRLYLGQVFDNFIAVIYDPQWENAP